MVRRQEYKNGLIIIQRMQSSANRQYHKNKVSMCDLIGFRIVWYK